MSNHPSLHTLRALLARDTAYFASQRSRLEEIQASPASQLTKADRNALQNWDKSVIKDCERQLSLLEEIEQPTSEEREVMRELHKLVVLGDHIVERRNAVWAELEGKLKGLEEGEGKGEGGEEVGEKEGVEAEKTSSGPDRAASPEHSSDSVNASSTQDIRPLEITTEQKDEVENTTDPPQTDTALDPIDPKFLYALIKIKPDAPLNEVKKAAKKAITLLHPDRNLGNPNAASKFADLQAACEVLEDEESRREFDETGKVARIEDLDGRLRKLVLEK